MKQSVFIREEATLLDGVSVLPSARRSVRNAFVMRLLFGVLGTTCALYIILYIILVYGLVPLIWFVVLLPVISR